MIKLYEYLYYKFYCWALIARRFNLSGELFIEKACHHHSVAILTVFLFLNFFTIGVFLENLFSISNYFISYWPIFLGAFVYKFNDVFFSKNDRFKKVIKFNKNNDRLPNSGSFLVFFYCVLSISTLFLVSFFLYKN